MPSFTGHTAQDLGEQRDHPVLRPLVIAGCVCLLSPALAVAAFPWKYDATAPPRDLDGKREWMYAATPEPGNTLVNGDPQELFGVRGAHIADHDAGVDTAWKTTTGRPDVTIAVLDSGIEWNNAEAMTDLRKKTRLTARELPAPRIGRATSVEEGEDCKTYTRRDDANGDGVFNVVDFSCDPRVQIDPAKRRGRLKGLGDGPADMLDPQDVLITFSNGRDEDRNGFKDDIVGWDFLDNDNDPFDDVQYGHGTGEARDSTAEADNGGELGTCPNCMVIHMRVGDSFIADSNDFAQAVLYAVDNGALVVQEALGTLNASNLGRQAVKYAYDHGVAVIASAADEAAQHHNYPSSYPWVIVVNSVTQYDETFTPFPRSYLQFNGCTNFSSKIAVAIPSVSCSSDATGRASGIAGLIYSAALDKGLRHPAGPRSCKRTNGDPCPLSANEVRQLMSAGIVGGEPVADDVSWTSQPETSCERDRSPGCTDPNLNSPGDHTVVSPLATTERYPARDGHDQFYGYGRANVNRSVDAITAGSIPPEVEIHSPDWYEQVDPGRASFLVRGETSHRGGAYTCIVEVAPGSMPNNAAAPDGDFQRVPSAWCDGQTARTGRYRGPLATIDIAALKARFPSSAGDFQGREWGTEGQTSNGRPNSEPYGFTVRVRVEAAGSNGGLAGQDRRNLYLHRDRDMLPGFPRQLRADGESSPLLVDLNGDNRNELVFGDSDGFVHAWTRRGRELRGWPVRGDRLPLHRRGRAFRKRAVDRRAAGAFLASVAVADIDHRGAPEVVAGDYEGKVYVWSARGRLLHKMRTNRRYGGRPLSPFVSSRQGKQNRTQHGFIGSPVLADVDRNDRGKLEIVAAAMDRHLYVWNHNGKRLRGFPTIVVDRAKVDKIDPRTHQVTFKQEGDPLNQGAIVDTPAVGDIAGDARPEIVVGTNEEYAASDDGGLNAANRNTASLGLISQTGQLDMANGRLYAIKPQGDRDGDLMSGPLPWLEGWPVKIGRLLAELLPVVGEGITGAPVIGPVDCPDGGAGPKVGVIPDAGIGYVLNPSGKSCYGQEDGRDVGLQTDAAATPEKTDTPVFPAVGHPAFGDFGGGVSFLAPAAGLLRALDLAVNEYQAGSQDFLAAWNASTGQFRPLFPARVNDLQFLTGPSVGDLDGNPGEEVIGGTANLDLAAFDESGAPPSERWPKLTSDWTVANPVLGTFGRGSKRVVVGLTRRGTVFAYETPADACAPASWPRFHHDAANSGDYRRDAALPGSIRLLRVRGEDVTFVAPGDDVMCGKVDHYELVVSDRRPRPRTFTKKQAIELKEPKAPGERESRPLPNGRGRFVGIRAVDDQGNLSRVAVKRLR
jgi:hypothetical protein